jgi:putative membrane protein
VPRLSRAALLLALGGANAALAHTGDAVAPAAPRSIGWSFEPEVALPLLAAALLYAWGLLRLWRSAGIGHGVTVRQCAAFAIGWLALALALVSPLDALGTQLFSAHMVQHELMMVLAAPLLVCGRPLALWAWALPRQTRRSVGRALHGARWRAVWRRLTHPASAWTLHAVALWAWHLPWLFDAALRDNGWHTAQHASFLGSALLFWWALMKPGVRASQGAALVYLFTTMLHTGALGALLTLSTQVWYLPYGSTTSAWGLSALEDQQLGGLVMWMPAAAAYLVIGLLLAARWIGLASPIDSRSAPADRRSLAA